MEAESFIKCGLFDIAARTVEFYSIYWPKSGEKQQFPLKRLILCTILQLFPQESESSVMVFQIGVEISQAAQINKH